MVSLWIVLPLPAAHHWFGFWRCVGDLDPCAFPPACGSIVFFWPALFTSRALTLRRRHPAPILRGRLQQHARQRALADLPRVGDFLQRLIQLCA